MPSGTKGVSIAVLATVVLTAAACGGSAKKAAPAPSPMSSASGSVASSPAAADTAAASRLSKLLLTDADDAGYTYDASQDGTGVTSTQDVVTTGGSVCQSFVDAQEALSTKYGTTAEVDRRLTKPNDAHTIQSSAMAFPSADKAAAMIADLTAGVKGCKSLSLTQGGTTLSMQPSAIPELTKAGQVGYIDYLTAGGSTELMAADLVQVGTTVSVVAIDGPLTNDPAALQQMGGTQLAHLSDVQVGRLKSAQGPS
ncbi:sensor domain-containing protein [Catenulispora acidiphila]|nr:sensor domain-containing protein [Catenulispora acidiphila]